MAAMYGSNYVAGYMPEVQSQVGGQQAPWPASSGGWEGGCMEGSAMGTSGSYSSYDTGSQSNTAYGGVPGTYAQQPQMQAQMQQHMSQSPQQQPQQQGLSQFSGGQQFGGSKPPMSYNNGSFSGGMAAVNGKGSFGADFGMKSSYGNEFGGNNGYAKGGQDSGLYMNSMGQNMGMGMQGAYPSNNFYEEGEFGFYPRYNQGSGPEYARNALSNFSLGVDDLEVTYLGETGEDIPKAITSWDEADLIFPPLLIQECRNAGFEKPMPIQGNTWGIGVKGRDLIGVAKTGSGKTLAYLFLGFLRILNQQRGQSPAVLILAPTRELAQQIEQESIKFGQPFRVRTACCYGGAPRGPQLGQLRRGAQVLVATPGRLNDFLQSGAVRLTQCYFLVLDEADRMLDLGFEPQIRTIIATLPQPRQTLLFTATWPKELRSLASDFLNKPIHVHIGKVGGKNDHLTANKDISQDVIIVQNDTEKMEHLRRILQQFQHGDRVLIFCETKKVTAELCNHLTHNEHIYSVPIHGDLAQSDRDWSLDDFKSGRAPIMVATDVAGRGLDIKGIAAVINWDAAHNAEDYVHRIGRTARAGEKGLAYTFLFPEDKRKARDIVTVMINTGIEPSPELMRLGGCDQRQGGFRKGKGKGKGKGKSFGKHKGGGFKGNKGKGGGGFGNFGA